MNLAAFCLNLKISIKHRPSVTTKLGCDYCGLELATAACAPEGRPRPLRPGWSVFSRLIVPQAPGRRGLHKVFSAPAKTPRPLDARGDAHSKIYGGTTTRWMARANGSFVISDCNNCKGRWSCISGIFNQSYLLGVINTLITVATRARANLCTRKVIIKPSKCHPRGPLTGVFNVRKNIFPEKNQRLHRFSLSCHFIQTLVFIDGWIDFK